MPAMLTSDNLSTWLSTRYAARNRIEQNRRVGAESLENRGTKSRELGLEANNMIRQQRKKSSSGRTPSLIDSEEYVDWLTPKRAKVVESNCSPKLETSMPTPINSYDTGNSRTSVLSIESYRWISINY